jgi:hypothetical protein
MSNELSIAPPVLEGPGSEGRSSSQDPPRRKWGGAAEPPEAAPPADPGQRLVIEETEAGLVYTVIDRASGAVVARTSREEVTRMGSQPGYAAGALIRAKA